MCSVLSAKSPNVYRPEILAVSILLSLIGGAVAHSVERTAETIPLISPWIDHHDRILENLSRLSPAVETVRFDIERSGGQESLDWFPAYGFETEVPMSGSLIILENAPLSALQRLTDDLGRPLLEALPAWIRRGGHLLIVGGSPSIESYADSTLEMLMGFDPARDVARFQERKTRRIRSRRRNIELGYIRVDHLHAGRVDDARVLLEADRDPFLIEKRIGRGVVTTLLSGAQGQLRRDGGEDETEWFTSAAWTNELRRIVAQAGNGEYIAGPAHARSKAHELAPPDAFDIRFFAIGNRPYPYGYAAGEAYERARALRDAGFTSVVFAANWRRPADDRLVLHEISEAGLRIVYYDAIRKETSADRFPNPRTRPSRSSDLNGRDTGWDVHDPRFRNAPTSLLQGREYVRDLPLRAVQIIEEFEDGSSIGPSTRALHRTHGLPPAVAPGDRRWIRAAAIRADATDVTFQRFRTIGQMLFPGLPQSTYLPGSYWRRPLDYGFRLTSLADAVDELLGPAYGYDGGDRATGVASAHRSATEAWAALRDSDSRMRHMAVYAQGRPLVRRGQDTPNHSTQVETAWTALAHGATGLAYWALPHGSHTANLKTFHSEMQRIGPWLRAVSREPAPIALLESWTSRSEAGDHKSASSMERCLQQTLNALELGFEDVDLIFEERVDRVPEGTGAIAIMATPSLSEKAAEALADFLRRGGHLFIDTGSALRTQPGASPLDLSERSRRPAQIHTIPLAARCNAARISSRIAATAWRSTLDSFGFQPRVETEPFDTEAALRGNHELVHLYLINHSDSPRYLSARLPEEWTGHEWVNLRTGGRISPANDGTLRTLEPIKSGHGDVWASSPRRLDRLNGSLEHSSDSLRLNLSGFDAAGQPVATGYPVRISIRTRCAQPIEFSSTLEAGRISIPVSQCPNGPKEEIAWSVSDPISGRSFRPNDKATSMHESQ